MALPSPPPVMPTLHPLLHALVLAIFSVGVLLTTGYGFGINDSANYIPLVWERIEPGVYRGDVMFEEILKSPWNLHTAFFSGLMGLLGKVMTLEWAFFLAHLVSLWGLFFAFWALGCAIGGPMVGYLGIATLAVNRIVGDVVMLLPDEFVPRSAAVTLAFLAVALTVRWQRFRLAAGVASLAILIHPISAAMALPLVLLAPLTREGPWRARLREAAVVGVLLAVPFLAWHALQASPPSAGLERGLFTLVSSDWQRLIDGRMMGQAVNVGPWKATDWLSIAVPLVFWLLALAHRPALTPVDRMVGLGVVATLVIAAVGSVAADVFRSSLFTQMMLVRVVFLPVVVGTVYGVGWLKEQFHTGDPAERILVLVVLAALMFAATPVCLLSLILLIGLRVARQDPWLRWGARGLAAAWLLLGVAIATLNVWFPKSPAVARPDLLVFDAPPLANVLLVAAFLGLAGAAIWRLTQGRLMAVAVLVAVAPLLLFGVTHRHPGPVSMLDRLAANVQAPWALATTPWREAAYWARHHTPMGSRFLVPLNEVGFRAMAKRPIAGNWKDGGLVLFSEAHAKRWEALYRGIGSYETLPPARVEALAQAHGCDFVVMSRPNALERPAVYENARFAIYAVAPPAREAGRP